MRGLDIVKFEQAVRARIEQFDSPTADQHARYGNHRHSPSHRLAFGHRRKTSKNGDVT
jgi:hypothetical protein